MIENAYAEKLLQEKKARERKPENFPIPYRLFRETLPPILENLDLSSLCELYIYREKKN